MFDLSVFFMLHAPLKCCLGKHLFTVCPVALSLLCV